MLRRVFLIGCGLCCGNGQEVGLSVYVDISVCGAFGGGTLGDFLAFFGNGRVFLR